MSEVLFEVTNDSLETGLRGYPVGYCTTSTVDPIKGLFYAGHPLSEMSHWEPEQVIYLLFHGKEGSAAEVQGFSSALRSRSACSPELIRYIRQLPRESHPMKLFRQRYSLPPHTKALTTTAKMPLISSLKSLK